MMEFRRMIYSGTCLCGHSYEDHHLCLVMNPETAKQIGPYVAQECEYYGCNEDGSLDEKGEYHCGRYIDAEDPDPEVKTTWKGTVRGDDMPWEELKPLPPAGD